MAEKICFIIMGFGRKTDFATGNTFDLDKTYKHIIRPAVAKAGYRCVRAHEIPESGFIDKSMYALLIQADLVIADISTYSPNAIYELGIRHAVRPFSTIIIKEKNIGEIPFDLDRTRMFTYSHLGEDLLAEEIMRSVNGLSGLISKVAEKKLMDSPLYEFMYDITPPRISDEEFESIIGDLEHKEKNIFTIIDKARQHMQDGDFDNACKCWEKASHAVPDEAYFIQQLAFAKYKSKKPSAGIALMDALVTIEALHPTNDPETLGLTGAIYKNMYLNSGDVQYLNRAIDYYGKGFKISQTYYTGENYALCLNMKAALENEGDEKIYYTIEANKSREKVLELLEEKTLTEDFEQRADKKWMFATLAHCYYSLKDKRTHHFEKKFLGAADDWERSTYVRSKEEIGKYIY